MRQRALASTLASWLTRIVPGLALGLGLVLTSCRVGPPPVTPAVVAAARASWPQATPWSLEQGRERVGVVADGGPDRARLADLGLLLQHDGRLLAHGLMHGVEQAVGHAGIVAVQGVGQARAVGW